VNEQQARAIKLLKQLGVYDRFSYEDLPSFVEFTSSIPKEFYALAEKLTGSAMSADLVATVEFMYPVLIAALSGNRCFSLKPDLALLLRDTDIPRVPTEMLRLPFPGITLNVPRETFSSPADGVTQVFLCHTKEDRFRTAFSSGPRSSLTHYINFEYDTSKDLVSSITATKNKHLSEEALSRELVFGWGKDNMYQNYFQTDVFRLALNAALYISSPNSDVKQDRSEVHKIHQKLQGVKGGARRSKLESMLRKAKETVIYIVGASIACSPEYQEASQLAATSEGRKLLTRHRVRGHFRQQPVGPSGSGRKLTWIEPFWRGPSFAELVEKGYRVK